MTVTTPSRAHTAALVTVNLYSDAARAEWEVQGGTPRKRLCQARLEIMAGRAVECASRLKKPGLMVLNDPVGTGKTLIALCAAGLLLHGDLGSASAVTKVLIVAPNARVAAIWRARVDFAGLEVRSAMAGEPGADSAAIVVATHQILRERRPRLPRDPSKLLLIIDEAHRGLHNPGNTSYKVIKAICEGARILMVTATPFQLSSFGLESMIEIDGNTRRGDRIVLYGRSVVAWLSAQHALDNPTGAFKEETLTLRVASAKRDMAARLREAEKDLRTVLMPTYPRPEMGMPEPYDLPVPTRVHLDDVAWARAYHVARILPEVVGQDQAGQLSRAKNNDAYIRMLDSSLGAWRGSSVCEAARESGNPALRELLAELEHALGSGGDHPKVSATCALAVERVAGPHRPKHVLIFCVWRNTQKDLQLTIEAELDRIGCADILVEAPDDLSGVKSVLQAFRRPASSHDPPIVLVVRDNLSESIDLDGGTPVVIHHDLAWSPVRWTQRMGRVVRVSSGFTAPPRRDVLIPVLETASDCRLWKTLLARRTLTLKVVPPDLESLLEQTLPDIGFDLAE